ncbi:CocE/NonD family hydrolase [Kitasatospora sp. NPDC052896]|uniref:CocE/NonD family hydrolase n=1 Tax=Kitasatospora sp. NPDC052896 TaxID=3364061 RepID=UPI0037C58691
MQHPSSYPNRITREEPRIPLPEGGTLHARLWRPVTGTPVPALLEYLPARLGDGTATRDAERHPWYAGHGYASLRVDARGHGNSAGFAGDEYAPHELTDGVAVIEWLARQPWCNGRVGLFGLGRGGTAGLQLAALAPEPLRAVVAVCATDDRYRNDGHHLGGSLLAEELPARSAELLALAAAPPDPRYAGTDADWRQAWLARLAAVEPPLHRWLAHQTRDHYWRRGSVAEDYRAIRAAVLAVGGWAEPHRDTVLRLVERLAAPVRGLIGPWAHDYPDRDRRHPIGFLQETLRWWDHWLKDLDTGVLAEPALRSWMPEPPDEPGAEHDGRWIGEDGWPSDDVREIHYDLADTLRTAGTPSGERYVPVRSPQQTGIDAGRPCPTGSPADLPPDQRAEDGRSVCFDGAPLSERVEILGGPVVRLRLRGTAARGQVVARLCDVAPDGSSALVTRGVLNLTARHGRDQVVPWEPGAVEEVEVELAAIAHAFPVGHRIRLALSSAYWPWIWPQPPDAGFGVDPGHGVLTLPVRHLAADIGRAPITFGPPEQAAPLEVLVAHRTDARPERLATHEFATGEWRLAADPDLGGAHSHPDGVIRTDEVRESYRIRQDDPLSATARAERTVRFQRPDQGWDVTLRSSAELSCDATSFTAVHRLTGWEAGAVVFERDWERRFPRSAG